MRPMQHNIRYPAKEHKNPDQKNAKPYMKAACS